MKQILTIIGLIILIGVSGQKLTFKGELVDSIKISSEYNFISNSYSTRGIYDKYLITFEKDKNAYYLQSYNRTKYKITLYNIKFKTSQLVKRGKITLIDSRKIANLLVQFEATYVKPTSESIGLTIQEFNKLTDKKYILKVANQYNYFKEISSQNDENEKIFKDCQSLDTFNYFLSTAFDTIGYVMVTHISDVFEVYISTDKNKYRFEGKCPNIYKQPWYINSTNGGFSTSLLNLSINNALIDLLPAKFSRLSTLKREALINEYIEWYLKRKNIIY